MGRYAQAVPELEKAVENMPQNAAAWKALGLACQETQRYTKGREAYRRATMSRRGMSWARF